MATPKKTFDPTLLTKLWTDIQAAEPGVQLVIADFVAVYNNVTPMMAAKPLKYGPNGCTDCGQCIDCTVHCLTQALASAVQAQNCLASTSP
jgi:ferredoxin